MGTALFARERETQTLEFLLARPVSRLRVLVEKSWPTALAVVIPIFLVNWSALFWSRQIGLELPFEAITLASFHAASFVLMFLAFTTWMSVLCRTQAHVAFWVGGITIVQLGIYMTQRLRPFSLFRLSDFECYGPILAGNTPLWQMLDPVRGHGHTTYVLLATLFFYLMAWRSLRRRGRCFPRRSVRRRAPGIPRNGVGDGSRARRRSGKDRSTSAGSEARGSCRVEARR